MLSPDICQWLEANQHTGYAKHLEANRTAIEAELSALGIDLNSELAYLYLNYGSWPVRGWYELNDVEQIREATAYAHTELGVLDNYLALTGIEGEGITLLDKDTGAVFDVEFGQFEQLASGTLAPVANSLGAFLHWCQRNEHAQPFGQVDQP